VLAGIWPARRATRSDLAAVIGSSTTTTGRKAGRLRAAVVGVQTAGATLLLACAALLVRNAVLSAQVDLGFERDRALILEIDPASHGYGPAAVQRLVDDLRARLSSLPGIASVAATSRVPFYVGFPERLEVELSGRPCSQGECPSVGLYRVGPDYFGTMGIRVRGTATVDRAADAASVVVSESAARQFWPRLDPIGQTLRIGRARQQVRVSGVAADVVHRSVGERPEAYIYLPFDEQAFAQPVAVVVRTVVDPAALAPSVAGQVHDLDRGLPIYRLRTMRQRLEARQYGGVPIVVRFFGTCGLLALFLSVIGLAGAVGYAVGQRAREFGIRSALGSRPSQLARLVLRGALRMTVPGVIAGLAASLLVTRLAARVTRGLDVDSPATLIAVAVAQLAVVGLAAMWPARRAAASDPLRILRAE
jgi:predicted permease